MENIIIASLSNSIQNVNHNHMTDLKKSKLKLSISSDTIDKTDESNKKVNKSYKKKKKKKKKSLRPSQIQALNLNTNPIINKKPKNPYRFFLLYKLSKKYESKSQIYDIKKINELIFNIPSHFTAIFKEYLIKEEEVEFLERLYNKIEINKKLKKIFYFYQKFSKIFPNYIVVPEGHYLYRNILKKQKIIDKIQKIKEEELKNKRLLLDGSFNTIFSNGAVDSIYSNMEPNNNLTLSNILFIDKNEKNEDEIEQIENIIENIKKYENNIINNSKIEPMIKRQTIYKKEFKDMRSLSKSIHARNQKENKGETSNNSKENEKKISEENVYKNKENKKIKKTSIRNIINESIMTKKLKRISDNNKYNTEDEYDEHENENENQNNNNYFNYNKMQDNNNMKYNYKKINVNINNNRSNKNNNRNNEKKEDEIIMKKKKKKFIILGDRNFMQNIGDDEKSIEKLFNTYTNNNDENLATIKTRNNKEDDNQLFYSRNNNDDDFRNSLTQTHNQNKSFLRNKNSFLYKKKLINDTRGVSISRKNTEITNNNNNTNTNTNTINYINKIKTTYTLNGARIVPIKKYKITSRRDISNPNTHNIEKENDNDNDNNFYTYLYMDRKQRLLDNDNSNNNIIINTNEKQKNYKTITTSKSNYELLEKNKNNNNNNNKTLNGNVYYKKHKCDNVRNSNGDKSCPPRREYNKHLDDTDNDDDYKKNSIEEKYKTKTVVINNNNNNNINNISTNTYRYHRMNHYNNKKFRLKAPKNYYKIDII